MIDPLRPGDPRQVGPYTLRGRLGDGGLGRVFLGRSGGGPPVAVKVVLPELAGDAGFRRRFAEEVGLARRVGGPFTARVLDADTSAGRPWLATSYVPGPSLKEAVRAHGPLPAEAVFVLGAGLAEGLAAIHARRLVHRDLNPGNVLLAADGPRLTDFCIARALDGVRRVPGTFVPPEQVRGHDVGPPGDVFSLGAVLAFAATGRSPFGGEAVRHDEPDLSGLRDDLAGLVAACLAENPGRRPALPDLLDSLTGQAMSRSGAGRRSFTMTPEGRTERSRTAVAVDDSARATTDSFPITTPAMRAAERVTDVGVGALQIAALFGIVGLVELCISRDPARAWEFTRHLSANLWWFWVLGLGAAFVHSGSDGHDLLTVDAGGLTLTDQRWIRLRDRSVVIPWFRVERVRLVAEPGGGAHRVVVTFTDEDEPAHHDLRAGHGGHVVARLSVADPARAAMPARLHAALARHGGHRYEP
ncbi:serine/threonine-protein kinase [Nonomuraea terrae]|uniref:serine/threonine-protein kinase n=1 Tax=Nonomuraea terrae TaxID=2530383 RepID=UPI001FE61988|nr:serine/threonine-protein kinase [Nonomuraea terrae]